MVRVIGGNTGKKVNGKPSIINGHAYLDSIILSWDADGHSATKKLERIYEDDNGPSFQAVYEQMHDGVNYLFVANLEYKADLAAIQNGTNIHGQEIYWNLHVSGIPEELDDVWSPEFVNINAFKNGGWNHDLKGSWTMTEYGDRDTTNAPEGVVSCKQAYFRSTARIAWGGYINHDGGTYTYIPGPKYETTGYIEERLAKQIITTGFDEAHGYVGYMAMQSQLCYGQLLEEFDYLGEWIGYRKAPRWFVTFMTFDENKQLINEYLLTHNGARAKNSSNADMILPPKGGTYKNKELDFEKTITLSFVPVT